MKHTIIDNRTEINRLKAENARLKAEVERLTDELDYRKAIAIRVGIEAAKEGKGHA